MKQRRHHSKKELQKHLHYNPRTGKLSWRIRRAHRSLHNEPGNINLKGYRQIKIDGRAYSAHRLAWLFVTGKWPIQQIDHKDSNKANNKYKNLRSVNGSQNKQNGKKYRTNKSGYKGVHWDREAQKWFAGIKVFKRSITLGRFHSKKQAYLAYCKAARKHFGEYARF